MVIDMQKKKFNALMPPHGAHLVTALGILAGVAAAPGAQAQVAIGPIWERASTVVGEVTRPSPLDPYNYDYTVTNTSTCDVFGLGTAADECVAYGGADNGPIIVDWELPWFPDGQISNIQSPTNWSFALETVGTANPSTGWEGFADWQTPGDPFYFGDDSPFTTVTTVAHWYLTCWAQDDVTSDCLDLGIGPGEVQTGFSFDSVFAATDAPYQASWAELPVRSGDPAFPLGDGGVPASPLALGEPTQPPVSRVPTPGTLPLVVLGVMGTLLLRLRRRR